MRGRGVKQTGPVLDVFSAGSPIPTSLAFGTGHFLLNGEQDARVTRRQRMTAPHPLPSRWCAEGGRAASLQAAQARRHLVPRNGDYCLAGDGVC